MQKRCQRHGFCRYVRQNAYLAITVKKPLQTIDHPGDFDGLLTTQKKGGKISKSISIGDRFFERAKKVTEITGLHRSDIFVKGLELLEAELTTSSPNNSKNDSSVDSVSDPGQPGPIMKELASIKKLQYRMIKELCKITEEDAKDTASGISLQAVYDDRFLHPEKYKDESFAWNWKRRKNQHD